MAFSADSRRMAVSAANGEIEIRDVPARRLLMTIPSLWKDAPIELAAADKRAHLPGGSEPIYGPACVASHIRFSPDGRRLAVVYESRLVVIWDISGENPARLSLLDEQALGGDIHRLGVANLIVSRDGRYLAVESLFPQGRAYRVWDIENQNLLVDHRNDKFLGWNPQMKFDSASRLFLLKRSYSHARPPLLAWDLATAKPAAGSDLEENFAAAGETTPDGSRQITVDNGLLKIIHRETGLALVEYAGAENYTTAVLSPDGNYLLAGNYDRVDLLDGSPYREEASEPQLQHDLTRKGTTAAH
jgi:WD40 repeat protein